MNERSVIPKLLTAISLYTDNPCQENAVQWTTTTTPYAFLHAPAALKELAQHIEDIGYRTCGHAEYEGAFPIVIATNENHRYIVAQAFRYGLAFDTLVTLFQIPQISFLTFLDPFQLLAVLPSKHAFDFTLYLSQLFNATLTMMHLQTNQIRQIHCTLNTGQYALLNLAQRQPFYILLSDSSKICHNIRKCQTIVHRIHEEAHQTRAHNQFHTLVQTAEKEFFKVHSITRTWIKKCKETKLPITQLYDPACHALLHHKQACLNFEKQIDFCYLMQNLFRPAYQLKYKTLPH